MKKLMILITCIISFFSISMLIYASENKKSCKMTINCETTGYEITKQFYYDGSPSMSFKLSCYPSSTGKNNCTFYNLRECHTKNAEETMQDLFKQYVVKEESKSVKSCK